MATHVGEAGKAEDLTPVPLDAHECGLAPHGAMHSPFSDMVLAGAYAPADCAAWVAANCL